MRRQSQKAKILTHLHLHGTITQGQAKELYGISRLASRMNELKKDGAVFQVAMIRVVNRDGSTSRVASYVMGGGTR